MTTTYTPNAFASGGALATQGAQVNALRGFTPNRFSGGPARPTPTLAPHLSVAAADRPFAADIALLQGDPEFASKVPSDIDKMWRYSPHTYQAQVANLLRQPGAANAVQRAGEKKMIGTTREITDDEGNARTQTYYDPMQDNGGWRDPRRPFREGE